jgi:hypothetical protein
MNIIGLSNYLNLYLFFVWKLKDLIIMMMITLQICLDILY